MGMVHNTKLVQYTFLLSVALAICEEALAQHRLSIALSHTLVPTAVNSAGNRSWFTLPSWGIDYDYELAENWGVGLHTDWVVQDFKYESNEITRDRTKPLTSTIVVSRKLNEHLTLLGGGGAEFAKAEETLAVIRLGIDYSLPLANNWECAFNIMFDYKPNAYNAIPMGVGLAKKF
jgi:hypothetical protein